MRKNKGIVSLWVGYFIVIVLLAVDVHSVGKTDEVVLRTLT
jgi:hypothetical protein